MKRMILLMACLMTLSLTLTGCFDDVVEPDPQPKSPPPTQQLDGESPEG